MAHCGRRAAHTLSAEGSYVDGPPKPTAKGAMAGGLLSAPRVHNCFTVWTRHEAGERGVAADCDALAASLRAQPLCPYIRIYPASVVEQLTACRAVVDQEFQTGISNKI